MPLNHHPADPQHPKGMAWALAAGFPDPRPGQPNQQLVLIQGWDAWSEQMWALGFRWHPELQTKWVKGGSQFMPGEILDEKPPPPPSLEEEADSVLDMIEESQPEFVKAIRNLRANGSEAEKQVALKELNKNVTDMAKIAEFVKGGNT